MLVPSGPGRSFGPSNVASPPMWLRHQRSLRDHQHLANSNALREYKKAITLNQIQKEVIVGTPFGLPAGDPHLWSQWGFARLWYGCFALWSTRLRLYAFKKRQTQAPGRSEGPLFCVQFGQTIASADYIWLLYSVFYDFVGTPPRVQNIRGGSARDRKYIWFRTFGNIDFKFYYDLFYKVETAGRS